LAEDLNLPLLTHLCTCQGVQGPSGLAPEGIPDHKPSLHWADQQFTAKRGLFALPGRNGRHGALPWFYPSFTLVASLRLGTES
jgi:hypothetical protein